MKSSPFTRLLKRIWGVISHNFGLKIISFLCALFLWSYVIYNNPNITRPKTLSGIEVNTSGQQVLASRGYALLTDIAEEVTPARVRVDVSQSNYADVTPETVRVDLDLSNLRAAGKQRVVLRGTSTYGKVSEIWPEYVELVVEELDSRQVPLTVELVNKDEENYYYRVRSVNPSWISVSGPGSIVRSVQSARVEMDMENITSDHKRAEQFTLIDKDGNEISTSTLTSSSNSFTVDVEVYPMKKVPIQADLSEVLTGEPADGYEVESVTVQPETISIAGEQLLLDEVHELSFEPVDVSGAKSSFSEERQLIALDDFKYTSSTKIIVTVNIREERKAQRFPDIPINLSNKSDNKIIELSVPAIEVRVTGPYSVVQTLSAEDLIVAVDVANLTVGEHSLPIVVTVDNHPDLEFTTDPETVLVMVSDRE